MENFGADRPGVRPANRPYAETRGADPDGNNFDLSVHGFQTVEYKKERTDKAKKEAVDA